MKHPMSFVKYGGLSLAIVSTLFITGCNKESDEPEENTAPVINETLVRYRHAHDDFWNGADLFFRYYVYATDSYGNDDIVYLSIKDCESCDERILKDTTSANEADHINFYDADSGYYIDDTYWYGTNDENRRPASFIVYARDKGDLAVTKTVKAVKPDLTEATFETFAYAASYTGTDTSEGFPALALPSGSNASIGAGVFNLTFNTNDINAKTVTAYFHNSQDEYVGFKTWDFGEFAANQDNTVSVSDYYISDGHTDAEVSYVYLFSFSGTLTGTKIQWSPHHAISARINLVP